jgi:hypothetical protein
MTQPYTQFGYGDPETWEGHSPDQSEDEEPVFEDEDEDYWDCIDYYLSQSLIPILTNLEN